MLVDDEYKGIRFIILNYFSHPCAYLIVDKTLKVNDEIINVHGGITYNSTKLHDEAVQENEKVIGWDYSHDQDFTCFANLANFKKYTTQEMVFDCKSAIDEIIEAKNEML